MNRVTNFSRHSLHLRKKTKPLRHQTRNRVLDVGMENHPPFSSWLFLAIRLSPR